MRLRLQQLAYRRLALPVPGFRTAHGDMQGRLVVVVRLTCNVEGERIVGWGEAAPLDDWGSESIARVERTLDEMAWPDEPLEPRELDATWPELVSRPATRAALETALVDIEARAHQTPMATSGRSRDALPTIPINAVIGAEASAGDIDALVSHEQCLKLKMGSRPLEAELQRVRCIREALPETTSLRIDANGRFDPERARQCLDELVDVAPEYVEQPVPRGREDALIELARTSPVPVAADESAHPLERARHLVDRPLDTLVLKPVLLGGPLAARRLARAATETSTRLVWTSAIGSAIERMAVGHVAAACLLDDSMRPQTRGPHGLGTGTMLDDDVADELRPQSGEVQLPDRPGLGIAPTRGALARLADGDWTTREAP